MSSQLRGRRSGPLWAFVLFLVIAALAIGYFFGAQQSGNPLLQSMAQVSASPTWTPPLTAVATALPAASVAVALVTTVDTPTSSATATPDLTMVQTVVAAQLAAAMAATLTAQPTPDQAATATSAAALVSMAVAATLAVQPTNSPTAISGGIGSNSHSCPGVVQTQLTSLREGPGTYYPTISTVRSGDLLVLIGRTESTTWFKIQMPDSAAMREGWIRADLITVEAGCTLPEIDPATATSVP